MCLDTSRINISAEPFDLSRSPCVSFHIHSPTGKSALSGQDEYKGQSANIGVFVYLTPLSSQL
jgi:hypothetical protein